MKTEFNVERVCERVHLCVVETPDEWGPPHFEIKNGSLYITFPKALVNSIQAHPGPGHPEWDGVLPALPARPAHLPPITAEEAAKVQTLMESIMAEVNSAENGDKPPAIWTPEHGVIEAPTNAAVAATQTVPETITGAAEPAPAVPTKPKKRGK